MTIALNVFAALVIRNKAKEITVEEKSSFWEFFLDVLSIPMAQIGNWLARKWREYNVVSVFFNVVIEMPFITVIEFIEDWRNFLKERKAEIH
jgi:ligand-binding SRPBCC domain-containing protein